MKGRSQRNGIWKVSVNVNCRMCIITGHRKEDFISPHGRSRRERGNRSMTCVRKMGGNMQGRDGRGGFMKYGERTKR